MASSINSHIVIISKYIDYDLQPFVKQIPSYVNYINDFINKINEVKFLPKSSYPVSMNARSLYTNIPNAEEAPAVKKAFDNYSKKTTTNKVIRTFLALILTLSNFVFDCLHYRQIKGCAIGTTCASAYANIFMASFELRYIYPYIKDKINVLNKVY